jgi:hypothetical protein
MAGQWNQALLNELADEILGHHVREGRVRCCQSNRNLSLIGAASPFPNYRSGHEVLPLSQSG